MAVVTLTYKGQTILQMNASGMKTLKTAGKYCEADIILTCVDHGLRADVTGSFDIDGFLDSVTMGGTAAELVETE